MSPAKNSSKNQSLYHYNAINCQDGIRLVRIEPGFGFQRIVCTLLDASISDPKLDYQALSYTWGNTEDPSSINCNGCVLPVTKDLRITLSYLRRRYRPVTFWIDQICINQKNENERGQQVQLMSKIYNHARRVVIWLGEEGDCSKEAFALVRRILTTLLPRGIPRDESTYGTGDIVSGRFRYNIEGLNEMDLPPRQSSEWASLRSLFLRRWFSRVWVVQEVVMGPEAVVICGEEKMSWKDLVTVAQLVHVYLPRLLFGADLALRGLPVDHVRGIESIRQARKAGAKPGMYELVFRHQSYGASNANDKIYALWGVADVQATPDYTKPTESLYHEMALQFLIDILGPGSALPDNEPIRPSAQVSLGLPSGRRGRLMALLYSAGIANQKHGLPSWVPDWSVESLGFPLWNRQGKGWELSGGKSLGKVHIPGCDWSRESIFKAGRSASQKLCFEGKICGRVTRVGTVNIDLRKPLESDEQQSTLAAWFLESRGILSSVPGIRQAAFRSILLMERTTQRVMQYQEVKNNSPSDFPLMRFICNPAFQSSILYDLTTWEYFESIANAQGRTVFVSAEGFVGLAPFGTCEDDVICILLGMDVPVVLRPVGYDYHLVGECYVDNDDVMTGKALRTLPQDPVSPFYHLPTLVITLK